jgi:hypothetical protein
LRRARNPAQKSPLRPNRKGRWARRSSSGSACRGRYNWPDCGRAVGCSRHFHAHEAHRAA